MKQKHPLFQSLKRATVKNTSFSLTQVVIRAIYFENTSLSSRGPQLLKNVQAKMAEGCDGGPNPQNEGGKLICATRASSNYF